MHLPSAMIATCEVSDEHKARHVVKDMEEMSMSNNGLTFRFAMLWKPRKSGIVKSVRLSNTVAIDKATNLVAIIISKLGL